MNDSTDPQSRAEAADRLLRDPEEHFTRERAQCERDAAAYVTEQLSSARHHRGRRWRRFLYDVLRALQRW